jgi:hypothetical protein
MMPNKSSNNYDETVSYVDFQKILTDTESHSFHFPPRFFSPLKLNMKIEEENKISNNKIIFFSICDNFSSFSNTVESVTKKYIFR